MRHTKKLLGLLKIFVYSVFNLVFSLKYFLDTMRIALFPPRVYNNGIKEREVLHMTYFGIYRSILTAGIGNLSDYPQRCSQSLIIKFLTFPPSDGIIHWCQRVWRNWQTRQI